MVKDKILPDDILYQDIKKFEDKRGIFQKVFDKSKFKFSIKEIRQCAVSFNKKKGTIRGMHYQKPPFSEGKIIFCLKGSLLDVFIDLRKKSKNFKKIYKVLLSSKKKNLLYIPRGYAHGFQTLENKFS